MSQSLAADTSHSAHASALQSHRAPRVEAFGQTDVGQCRELNEDSLLVLPSLGLFAVADGMGGAACGEIASRMAVEGVREMFEQPDATWPWAAGQSPCRTPGARLLMAGIQRANGRILALAQQDEAKKGMGTTFAGILTLEDRVVIAHVGDSRVYRLRGRQFDLLTEDHSLLNACIRAGTWDPAEADAFPQRNVITRAVGVQEDVEIDTRLDALVPGDTYLICSDGLHGMLDHRDIASILVKHPGPTEAVARLIERANDNGGDDNITAVAVRIVGSSARP